MPEKPIIIERVIPGAFYQSVAPGGFTDAVTGIHIPGPTVHIDPVTRGVAAVAEMPAPVQIPHLKRTFDLKDNLLQVEAPFNRVDAEATTEGLNMALQTGIIRRVSDEEVKELYPAAFAARNEKIVYRHDGQTVVPMASLVDQFQEQMRKAKSEKAKRSDTADAAAAGAPKHSAKSPKKTAPKTVKEPETAAEAAAE